MLRPGDPLPDFSLPSSDGSSIGSSDLSESTAVIYFYPKADTPGCTKEACGFSDAVAHYQKIAARVVGISPDPVRDVKAFADKFALKFPLLADEDHAVCEAFGVWGEKQMAGRTYLGALRTTFVVRDGKVAHVFENVQPDGHDREVLRYLQSVA
jgi:thioredoxin-dependent peroxiredoxin